MTRPKLLIPAIYIHRISDLKRVIRVSRVNDAIHVEFRWPWQ